MGQYSVTILSSSLFRDLSCFCAVKLNKSTTTHCPCSSTWVVLDLELWVLVRVLVTWVLVLVLVLAVLVLVLVLVLGLLIYKSWVICVTGFLPADFQLAIAFYTRLGSGRGQTDRQMTTINAFMPHSMGAVT